MNAEVFVSAVERFRKWDERAEIWSSRSQLKVAKAIWIRTQELGDKTPLFFIKRLESILNRLDERFQSEQDKSRRLVDRIPKNFPERKRAEAALEKGEFDKIALLAKKASLLDRKNKLASARLDRLSERICLRGLRIAGHLRRRVNFQLRARNECSKDVADECTRLANRLSEQLFNATCNEAQRERWVKQAEDSQPEMAGHYNPNTLAAETLQKMDELSPIYTSSYISALADLESLHFLAPQKSAPKKKAKAKSKKKKRAAKKKPA